MEETQKIQDKKTNAKLFPIYKMFSWDLLFYYSIIFSFCHHKYNTINHCKDYNCCYCAFNK